MNYDSDEDRYDSSVYSDDESILNQKDDDSYMDEEEMPEEFFPMMKARVKTRRNKTQDRYKKFRDKPLE